ncbi:MAG: peptidoglycan DD-metalloendopeptidase family protein [Bacteroidales bacterium]|nr:peptidoglycan DD-metalloendopeptidase family protein [Bacteroidales bacterium]
MRRLGWLSCVILTLLLHPAAAHGQSKKQLEKDKARVEQEIKKLNNDLAKAKKNSRSSQQQLSLLEKKIAERTKLINNINGQMNLLSLRMAATEDSISLMRTQVDSLKLEYGKVVRTLYRERDNISPLVLMLDTKSYNYAYLRTKYFRDYSRYRRRQASVIQKKEQELGDASLELQRQQREQNDLLAQQRRQKDALAKEQKEKQQSLKASKQQEKTLQQQIAKKEQQKKQLQQQIQKIINEEIAKAARSKKPASTGGRTGNSPTPSSAETALTSDFASNKGRLPWPCYYNKVAREYGKYTHSSGGQNMNNGIDLLCKPGAPVKAVFNGTVSRVFTCPNGTRGIIIRHGEYMTVYANLATVTVAEGKAVATNQNLGTVYTADDGTAEFSFQIWKGTTSQNPRQWLR